MKLYVDDIRNAPDDTWTVARTVSSAISAIARFRADIEVISLDHDISHQINMGAASRPYPCDETFTPVCYFIGEVYSTSTLKMPEIVIHTSNPNGAVTMGGILQNYGIEFKQVKSGPANRLETEL